MECITHGHCISHLVTLPPHFTLHHSTSNAISDIPSHTTFQVSHTIISSHHIAHFISHQHLSQHTIPLCNTISVSNLTISATLCIAPHRLALHPIFTFLTDHITPRSMYSTPHFRSRHILATSFIRTTFYTRHYTAFHILHILHHSTTSL